jgi:hypothetical protein
MRSLDLMLSEFTLASAIRFRPCRTPLSFGFGDSMAPIAVRPKEVDVTVANTIAAHRPFAE